MKLTEFIKRVLAEEDWNDREFTCKKCGKKDDGTEWAIGNLSPCCKECHDKAEKSKK